MNFLRTLPIWSFSVALVLSACGGSSGSNSSGGSDPVALCMQGCTKEISLCYADAGAEGTAFASFCTSQCSTPRVTQTKTCTNSSEIISSVNACLAKKTCAEYEACFDSLPDCAGGGSGGTSGAGTGGSTGHATGGTTGTATGGSTGTGTSCADLVACCNASGIPEIKASCMMSVVGADDAACAVALAQAQAFICP